jgi:hypothetical protein
LLIVLDFTFYGAPKDGIAIFANDLWSGGKAEIYF